MAGGCRAVLSQQITAAETRSTRELQLRVALGKREAWRSSPCDLTLLAVQGGRTGTATHRAGKTPHATAATKPSAPVAPAAPPDDDR